MTKEAKEGYVFDYISGKEIKATPEEIDAVQIFSKQLVEDYGYPKDHIQTRPQFRVKIRPSDRKKEYPVDIAVFSNNKKIEDEIHIIVECKKKNRKDGKSQLQDYLRFSSETRKNGSSLNQRKEFIELQKNEEFILSVTSNGFGKRSSAYEYRISNRGGKGITGIKTTLKNGKVIDSFIINDEDQLILVSDQGQIIRVSVNQIRIAGRSTQGVSIFNIPKDDKIVSVSRIVELKEDE